MLPAAVSMRMLAWPVPVIRTPPRLATRPRYGPGGRARLTLNRQRVEREPHVAANEEPVTSPDQHKPGSPRAARAGAVGTVVVLLMLAFCAHGGSQESMVGFVWL